MGFVHALSICLRGTPRRWWRATGNAWSVQRRCCVQVGGIVVQQLCTLCASMGWVHTSSIGGGFSAAQEKESLPRGLHAADGGMPQGQSGVRKGAAACRYVQ
jgi:hypothetical protein